MPAFVVRVEVWLKEGLVDAEGRTVREALNDLGYRVLDARVGKVYELTVEAGDRGEAERLAEEMCRRLLANPVRDRYAIRVEGPAA